VDQGIPVVSEDVGKQHGRKLIFHVEDGTAWVKRLREPMQIDFQAILETFRRDPLEVWSSWNGIRVTLEEKPARRAASEVKTSKGG
jgi:hypothetical protein